jgi:hypothetical protein
MKYAENAWLFFPVSIPLTVFAIIVWYTWANYMRLYPALMVKQEEHRKKLLQHINHFLTSRKTAELPS